MEAWCFLPWRCHDSDDAGYRHLQAVYLYGGMYSICYVLMSNLLYVVCRAISSASGPSHSHHLLIVTQRLTKALLHTTEPLGLQRDPRIRCRAAAITPSATDYRTDGDR